MRIVAQPSLKISLQTLKRNRPLFMLCIGALCVLISTFAVSASSLFYVRYVLNDAGLFTVLVLVQNPGRHSGIGTAGAGNGCQNR